jgi:hypothetical protein
MRGAELNGALCDMGKSMVRWRSALVSPELVMGLQMGWNFGGMAMLVPCVIVIALFRAARQRRGLPALVVPAIGAGYQPFIAIFMLPATT